MKQKIDPLDAANANLACMVSISGVVRRALWEISEEVSNLEGDFERRADLVDRLNGAEAIIRSLELEMDRLHDMLDPVYRDCREVEIDGSRIAGMPCLASVLVALENRRQNSPGRTPTPRQTAELTQ